MMNESKSTEVRQSLKSLSLVYCLVLAATIFTIFSNNVAVPTEAFLLGFGFDVVLQGSFRVLGLFDCRSVALFPCCIARIREAVPCYG